MCFTNSVEVENLILPLSLWIHLYLPQLVLAGSEKQQELASCVLTLKAIYLTVVTCYFTKCKDYKRVLREVKDFHR